MFLCGFLAKKTKTNLSSFKFFLCFFFQDNQSENSNHSTDQSGASACSTVPTGYAAMTKYNYKDSVLPNLVLKLLFFPRYVPDPRGEVFGTANDQVIRKKLDSIQILFSLGINIMLIFCKTQEISDENKSIIWFLIKQVRPGMDLSKVVLPTFILEPRSFLEKLSDYYYHADLLAE